MKKVIALTTYTQSSSRLKQATLKRSLGALGVALILSSPTWAQSSNPHAISLYNLGLSAYKQGSPESAIIFFKRACDIDPDLADAQYNLGVLYQSEKRLKEAVTRFQEVLRIKPQDADAHYQLGLALIDLNRFSEAKEQLLAIAPNNTHFVEAQKKLVVIGASAGQTQSGSSGNAQPDMGSAQTYGSGTGSFSQLDAAGSTYTQTAASASPVTPVVTSTNPNINTNSAGQIQSAEPSTQSTGNQLVAAANTPTDQSSAGRPNQIIDRSQEAQTSGGYSGEQRPALEARQPAVAPQSDSYPANAIALQPNSSISIVANGFSAPAGIAFDKQGNLYVANFLTSIIDRISADGLRSQFCSGVNLKGPIGLIVDDLGTVYVANYLSGTIARINPAGISSILASGLKKPYYLTLDRDNNLLVSQQDDNSIVRITLPKAIGAQPH